MPRFFSRRVCPTAGAIVLATLMVQGVRTQQTPQRFGGSYDGLDARRQRLVADWLVRFTEVTGQKVAPQVLYDDLLSLSSKTTFDAVTHALMTTTLTDTAGAPLGDALALVERVDTVRGEQEGAAGDRQFRMYVRLTESAYATLQRSQQFLRGADNSVYHKGYPINFRQQGGVPAMQISIALDHRLADIDVDYRAASFPKALFNGHLSASNSDVRAGNNSEKHANRWSGFESWWRSLFGLREERAPADAPSTLTLPRAPRAGKQPIEAMVHDFLTAWLVEGDQMGALSFISERAYACLAQDSEDPSTFDRGMAPFLLLNTLKAAHESVGKRASLDGLTVGVNLAIPALRVVKQPHHANFVLYSVPDDIAAGLDCENRLTPGDATKTARKYGTYHGATFVVNAEKDQPLALLWAREDGYWKIVSWKIGFDREERPAPEVKPETAMPRLPADASLVEATHTFLDQWLVRRDYDAAMAFLSATSYACYDLLKPPGAPAATSPADAAARIRGALKTAGEGLKGPRNLDALVSAVEPNHPAVRLLTHRHASTYSLASLPTALATAVDCASRLRRDPVPETWTPEYGEAFAMSIRVRTRAGDAPVLRTLWRRENGAWRITAYDVELP